MRFGLELAHLIKYVFQRHDPGRVSSVPKLMKKYKGREADVFKKVCDKYGLKKKSKISFEKKKLFCKLWAVESDWRADRLKQKQEEEERVRKEEILKKKAEELARKEAEEREKREALERARMVKQRKEAEERAKKEIETVQKKKEKVEKFFAWG